MNLLNRMMSYDKTKNENQENCNCAECLGNAEISEKREIAWDFKYADDFLTKIENYRLMCREYKILNTMNLEYWYKDVKTKNFIWKSLHVHGDKYIYHKSVYVKSKEKLLIECRNGHEPFPQSPNDHLRGHGCKLCGIKIAHDKTRMTLKEFIEEANQVHGEGRYDYSEVKYVDYKTEVWIICHKHDEPYRFSQTPNDHLRGEGCFLCGVKIAHEKQKLTLEEFIEKSNKIHGVGKYDYSKVNYINNKTLVTIICHNHKKPYEFPQTPNAHLDGHGCNLCNKSQGENKIELFLMNNNIEFKKEKKFKDCKDKYQLPFDFYLPQYNLCIEFDGEQHFNPSSFSSRNTSEKEKLENLQYIQKHDKMKNDYCKKNGIILLRFNNLKTVEQELAKYFQNHGIIEQTIFNL